MGELFEKNLGEQMDGYCSSQRPPGSMLQTRVWEGFET
jgi:hypothetical protein